MKPQRLTVFLCLLALGLTPLPVYAAKAPSVYIEDLTWLEIRDSVQQGATIVIIPTGGTEQNGPQMVVGKHNFIVRYTSGEIAKLLGNALVAPVIPYTPEGRIDPPEGHMQFPGTMSVRDETYAMLLEDTASSLRQHGFRLICFVGDHGGNQAMQQQVAQKLTDVWRGSGVRVISVSDYYANNGQEKWVETLGIKVPNPGAHAGLIDTSEMMAVDPHGIRSSLVGVRTERDYTATGSMGDSTKATINYGRRFLSLKIEAAADQIKNASYNTR